MRQAELLDQAQQRTGFFQGIEVFALDVLDERHGDRVLIGDIANDGGNLGKPRHLRRAPAPLAGDDFIALRFDREGRGSGRTRMGCTKPRDLIESASSPKDSGRMSTRG